MACDRYDIFLVDAEGRARQQRQWTKAQLLDSVAWLKRMNARGHNVLIRPDPQSGLMLMERVTESQMKKLADIGVPCQAKIEVEEGNYQVWLSCGGPVIREAVAKSLAKRFNLPEAKEKRFGALAGFVIHRPQLQNERGRFVLAHMPQQNSPEKTARWDRLIKEAEALAVDKARGRTVGKSRGVSR